MNGRESASGNRRNNFREMFTTEFTEFSDKSNEGTIVEKIVQGTKHYMFRLYRDTAGPSGRAV